jgi:hypothetical protein
MAIKLTTDQIVNGLLAFLLLLLAVLLATGCKADADVTGVDLSKTATTTTTVPVSAGDVGGDLTVITVAGATPWTIAGLVGLLWALRAKQQRTATGTVDRIIGVIEDEHEAAKNRGSDMTIALQFLKTQIAIKGGAFFVNVTGARMVDDSIRGDRSQCFLRSRLKRLKK